MFDLLVKHGCVDLSSSIDLTRRSFTAVASGGFGDVWRTMLFDGRHVVIKTLRRQLLPQSNNKDGKVALIVSLQFSVDLQSWVDLALRARDVYVVKAPTF